MSSSTAVDEGELLFAEEVNKPFFFLNASVANLHQQLQNASLNAAVVRNGDKWPSSGATDINRVKLECVAVQDQSGALVQNAVIKERKVKLSEAEWLEQARGGRVDQFAYFFEARPKERFDSLTELLESAGFKPLMAHHWAATSFRRPKTCSLCLKFIWGVTDKSGFQCRVCDKAAHAKCYAMMPPRCAGVAMSKAERQELAVRKVFNSIDVDGSGTISFSELVKHMGMTPDEAALFIKAFDKDKNTLLDYHEFSTLIRNHFLKSFRQFDKNDDGEITAKELKDGFKELGMNLSSAELLNYMTQMDADEDGVITLDEYVEACFVTIAMKAAEEELRV